MGVLRVNHTLKAFEFRVLKTIFGPKNAEVSGGWRKQHNEELNFQFLFSLPPEKVPNLSKECRIRLLSPRVIGINVYKAVSLLRHVTK